ncbi:hypothetical protein INR49_021030 [Caranx melampygus]|nr:hypothetical protein INR49_021030 [Caranx melampygus]
MLDAGDTRWRDEAKESWKTMIEQDKCSIKMDYKYDNGIELLLAHMNIEDIINAAETLYQLKEEEEAEGLSFEEEGLSQEEMDENEEQKDFPDGDGGVRYGTVTDLLSFVNLLSNMQTAALQHLPREMGVLLNKLTYKNRGTGLVPKGSFGKVHLAQDTATRKRMAYPHGELQGGRRGVPGPVPSREHRGAVWRPAVGAERPPVHGGRGGRLGAGEARQLRPHEGVEIIWVTKQVLRGLEYLHSHNVIHHDIKPSNIVLMTDKAVLVDFGLTVQMTDDVYTPRDLRGTEMYMSPELVLCRGHNTKTDIYSLGTTIIHMQTGSPPGSADTPALPTHRTSTSLILIFSQIHKQAPPLEDIAEDCSPVMRSFLERALEKNPALRGSASELLKHEAINPPIEDQPRCWSLDSALEEATHTILRQQSQHHDTTQESSLYSEDSGHTRRKGSLYLDLGALSGYCKLVTGPPTADYG